MLRNGATNGRDNEALSHLTGQMRCALVNLLRSFKFIKTRGAGTNDRSAKVSTVMLMTHIRVKVTAEGINC